MIKIESTQVTGWEAAIRGMRNPMNSWDKSDSGWRSLEGDLATKCVEIYKDPLTDYCSVFAIGDNDEGLMMRLRNAGTDHRKFMRMIVVYADIIAPLYW